jgi:hypothetical protein
MLKPYKFLIQAVAQQIDDDGNVVGESVISANGEPFTVFGCDSLAEFATAFPGKLAAADKDAL